MQSPRGPWAGAWPLFSADPVRSHPGRPRARARRRGTGSRRRSLWGHGRSSGGHRAQTSEPPRPARQPRWGGRKRPPAAGEEGNLNAGLAVRPHVLGRLVTRHYSGARWPAQQTRLHVHTLSEHPDNPGVSGLLAKNWLSLSDDSLEGSEPLDPTFRKVFSFFLFL